MAFNVSAYYRYVFLAVSSLLFASASEARSARTLVVNPGSGVTTAVDLGDRAPRARLSLANARGVKALVLRRAQTVVKLRIEAGRNASPGPRRLTIRARHGDIRLPLYVPFGLPAGFLPPRLTAGLAKTIELPTAGVRGGLRIATATPCLVSAGRGAVGFGRAFLLPVVDRKTARFSLVSTNNSAKHACHVVIQERLDNRYDGRALVSKLRVPVKPDSRAPAGLAMPRLGRVAAAKHPRLSWSKVRHVNAWEVLIRPRGKHGKMIWQTVSVENGKRIRGLKAGPYEWKVRAHYRQPGGILDIRSKFSRVGRFRVIP